MTVDGNDRSMGMTGPDRIHVAVIGAGRASDQECEAAEKVGRLIAEGGAVLVCGGLGGVMEAACLGARTAGGTTIGILPGTNRLEANDYVDVAIPTGIGEARNALVVGTADAVVAVGGEFGTLSEIALALKVGTPVIGIGTWDLAREDGPVEAIVPTAGPNEAVDRALELGAARLATRRR